MDDVTREISAQIRDLEARHQEHIKTALRDLTAECVQSFKNLKTFQADASDKTVVSAGGFGVAVLIIVLAGVFVTVKYRNRSQQNAIELEWTGVIEY